MHSRYNLKNNQIRPKSKGIAIRINKSNNKNNKRDDSFDSVLINNNENNISIIKNNNIKREDPFEILIKNINDNIDNNIAKKKLNKNKKSEQKLLNEITKIFNLYFMERNIKASFSDLIKNDKNKKFYLINKSFIKNLKKNFKYEYIQSHLINVKEKNDNLTKDIIFQLSINPQCYHSSKDNN